MTGWLPDIWCCNSIFNSHDTDVLITWPWYVYTWHLIPDTWYLTLVLDMVLLGTWYLTLDIWHQYLTCYYLTPDTWHLISDTDTWHVITWHLIPDTWYMTPENWHAITWYLIYAITWYWHIWPDIVTPDWILLHLIPIIHFIFMIITLTGTLTWLLYCYQLVLLNFWTSVLLNSCIPCTHVPCTITHVNSTVIPASSRAFLVSGWRGCIPRSC